MGQHIFTKEWLEKRYEEEKRDRKFFQKKLEEANLRILKLLEEKKEG